MSAFLLNGSANAKCEQVDILISFVRYVRNQVDFFALPAELIIEGCDDEMLWGCGLYNIPRGISFEMLASECDIYDKECERIMREFLCGFGKCYREEQLRECERCVLALESRREELFSELPKKKKINCTVCISAALCLGILLA